MLIIGHRGAAGLAPENTPESLQAGYDAGADMLEFDVRLTADNIPILAHDPYIKTKLISRHTLAELRELKEITTLQEVLDTFFNKILLNIELKQPSSAEAVYALVKKYITHADEWENVIFSSFKSRALYALRAKDANINLALLHHINPFSFIRHNNRLQLTAVGFHRLHVNVVALAAAHELGIFTYAYTVDKPSAALRLNRRGIDGIVTNYPDRISRSFQTEA